MKRLMLLSVWLVAALMGQDRRAGLDVESYKIEARIDPSQQTLTAATQVTFTPQEDRVTTATFELNNALNLTTVTDSAGATLSTQRTIEGHTVRVNFPQPLVKGTAATITFNYSGRLTGEEEGPVLGLRFAAITSDHAYLLYPARWFPVSGYTTDRYTMDLGVSVPSGFQVVTSGLPVTGPNGTVYKFGTAGFPGSVAVVRGTAQKVAAEGVTTDVWFEGERQSLARAYGEARAKVMNYLTCVYGVPPVNDLTRVDTGEGAQGGSSARRRVASTRLGC